jgi:hypothetical protein
MIITYFIIFCFQVENQNIIYSLLACHADKKNLNISVSFFASIIAMIISKVFGLRDVGGDVHCPGEDVEVHI